MMKNAVKPRVTGLETEYALTSGRSNTFLNNQNFNSDFFLKLFPASPYVLNHYANVFLPNGARIYIDVGEHPEYATPECQSVASLVIYDKAGQKMMEQAEIFINDCIKNPDSPELSINKPELTGPRQEFKDRLQERYYPVRIFRNNLSPAINPQTGENFSWGSHENYMMSLDVNFPLIENILTPFLISRQIYGGSGWLNSFYDDTIAFFYAQRPLVTHFKSGGGTTGVRPIINTKNEPWSDASKFRRLHLIMGDSNMSPWSAWLKIKATSLVLDLIEDEDFAASLDFSDLQNPVTGFKKISQDLDFSHKFLAGGRRHTALSLQRLYLDLATRYYLLEERKEADEEIRNAIEFWQMALDLIEAREYSLLAPFLDNFAKLQMFEAILSKAGVSLRESRPRQLRLNIDISNDLFNYLKQIDISYHRVCEKESVYFVFQKSKACLDLKKNMSERFPMLKKEIVFNQDIENALTDPPQGRAKWRRMVMKLAEYQNQTMPVKYVYPNWDNCRIRYEDGNEVPFYNTDPYCEMTRDLKSALGRCQNSGENNNK